MAFSLFSVVSLSVIYRLTINFPELPYTHELKNVESDEYVNTARDIAHSIQSLVADLEGKHTARVVDYKYHKVIGSLVYVDLYAEKESPRVSDVLLNAVKTGRIGNLTVSDEGFELHVVRDSESACATTEFTCLDKSCIPADRRCDGRRDCPDGSDEHKDHGKCKQHQPIIHQTEKIVFAPKRGSIHLSAAIDHSIGDNKVAWSKDGVLLGVGKLTLAEDSRVSVYQKGEKYYLHIVNATDSDDGTYKMIVQGMNVEADFEVRITSDRVAIESDECPSGERACKSGHCLPVSQFCDRRVQCPDGDDEENCSEVECKSNEFRCESTNVCVPTVVVCDGWKDCHDGSDEKKCSHPRKTYKPHHFHHVKVNALCHDGSEPEFSLHGSSYCWSNKVCPTLTECVHGLCCPISKTRKRQSECLEGQFKCGSGQCIEESQKCNRKYDCADGSDEITCDYYIAVQKYHQEQQKQDQSSQSSHSTAPTAVSSVEPVESTEPELVCSDQEFRCPFLPETRCFHYDKLCDGVDDCGDGSDETNCDSNEDQDQPAAPIPPPQPAPSHIQDSSSRCTHLQFECKRDGKCIDKSLECNHKYDCDDGSDETECEYFKAAMARRQEVVSTTTEQVHHQQHHQQQQQSQQESQQHHQQHHPAQPSQPAQPAHPGHPAQTAQSSHDQHEEHRRRLEEHRRREEEHKRRQEEESRARAAQQQSLLHASQVESTEVTFHDEYDGDSGVGCLEHEFQCAIGECIDKRRVCDTRPDCLDASDEQNCADRAQSVPEQQPSLPPVNNYPGQLASEVLKHSGRRQ